ncbi:MAG: PDZ domain-containing protein [Gemmataceae bacterium]|nr:PDZ domain-containing protein [Gemmataceae bacterium]MCS7270522.1 PDZ domain-containing protein [Gemmataceae bacterium]MDW8242263.1 PDZ domain-containing protein [Thermogemmata sp.]
MVLGLVVWSCIIGTGSLPVMTPVPAGVPERSEPSPDPTARGYMGVVLNMETLAIEAVEPGKPAARAGLQPQDIIVRVNQFHPQTTQQVIDYVCSCRPGAILEVEVRRGSERKIFQVRLIARPQEADRGRPPIPYPDEPPPPE